MKNGEERIQAGHAEEPPPGARLNVQFFHERCWNAGIKAGPAPDFRRTKRRVLTLSVDDNLNQAEPPFVSVLGRAIAWAVVRARAAAGS